jgi:single-strand DNA-binding protein
MSGLNKVLLIGRLGRDPEDRMTAGGTKVSHFSMATDQFRNVDGGTQKFTEWHRIVAFGKVAEQCNQYLKKGRLVFVEGTLQTRSWEKPPGDKRFMTEVIAARVNFLDSNGGASGRTNEEQDEPHADADF